MMFLTSLLFKFEVYNQQSENQEKWMMNHKFNKHNMQ